MDLFPQDLNYFLKKIRALYVDELSQAVQAYAPCHVEPALRRHDGTLAAEGTPPTPHRMDLIVKATGESVRIDSTHRLTFQTRLFEGNGLVLSIAPFFWDSANFRAAGLPSADEACVASWFERWFDADDQNAPDEAGLYQVVHSMSSIEASRDDQIFQVDFGSAPVEAFSDLIDTLLRAGARAIEVS